MSDLDYARFIRRLGWISLVLLLAGSLAWWVVRGAGAVWGFLGGAALSGLSFYLLHRLVADLQAAAGGRKVRKSSFVVHATRTLILGGTAYVILEFCGASRAALASGLTVVVAAAAIKVLIEWFYARA